MGKEKKQKKDKHKSKDKKRKREKYSDSDSSSDSSGDERRKKRRAEKLVGGAGWPAPGVAPAAADLLRWGAVAGWAIADAAAAALACRQRS